MTTYPLSEPATIRRTGSKSDALHQTDEVVARGSLPDCAEILEGWAIDQRASIQVDIDDMSLRYGPEEIEELLAFLREEGATASAIAQAVPTVSR